MRKQLDAISNQLKARYDCPRLNENKITRKYLQIKRLPRRILINIFIYFFSCDVSIVLLFVSFNNKYVHNYAWNRLYLFLWPVPLYLRDADNVFCELKMYTYRHCKRHHQLTIANYSLRHKFYVSRTHWTNHLRTQWISEKNTSFLSHTK